MKFIDVLIFLSACAICSTDGKFVDIIHTRGGMFGAPGHADFYPNGGRRTQPGCRENLLSDLLGILIFLLGGTIDHCSYDASVHYYAESLRAKTVIYQATNKLNATNTAQMGYKCSSNARGDYKLKTKAALFVTPLT